jgi:hypothetical protein
MDKLYRFIVILEEDKFNDMNSILAKSNWNTAEELLLNELIPLGLEKYRTSIEDDVEF